jgi:hypothetical protein
MQIRAAPCVFVAPRAGSTSTVRLRDASKR